MKKILWCGDSTVVGRTLRPGSSELIVSDSNEVAVCTDLLKSKHGQDSVISVNAGRGGSNIAQWCNGDASQAIIPFASRMDLAENSDVDIVVLQIGINDSFNPAIGVNDFMWCLQEIHRIVSKIKGKKIVFCTPCPIDSAANVKLWSLQFGMKSVAKTLGVPVVDHYSALLSATANWKPMLSDKIHPTDDLYRFKGNTSFVAISQLFE
ncbi:SGNH/GDSL hydrolase family protein [Pseudomonas atacamensis]|uniref:SGNH/GDSL hydrolase family protein n=1 Tax=Pseudomonas atacamensis TaxID=2565368 RepID=UPI003824CFAC